MNLSVEKELAALRRMSVDELRWRYAGVFGEATKSRHKQWLIKRILWRMQALAEGDLSQRARRRAEELANDADLRLRPPRTTAAASPMQAVPAPADRNSRLPPPGTVLTRPYKGETLQVRVLPEGFEYEGEVHKSLSAVAKAITGSQCNGYRFFRLGAWGVRLEGKKTSHAETGSGRSACGHTRRIGCSTPLRYPGKETQDDAPDR